MVWIKVILLEEAGGNLKRQYDAAINRASKVWNIVSIMSLNLQTMHDSMRIYKTFMFSESPLSRKKLDMLATVVSSVNHRTY